MAAAPVIHREVLQILVNGKPATLRFDLGAMLTLSKQFGIDMDKLAKEAKQNPEPPTLAEEMELFLKLVFAMTRTNEHPPELRDVEAMSLAEIRAARPLVNLAMVLAQGPVAKDPKAAAAAAPVRVGSVSRGTSARRSSRR